MLKNYTNSSDMVLLVAVPNVTHFNDRPLITHKDNGRIYSDSATDKPLPASSIIRL